jgi:Spy/CpxP family protein refolding chaperone
MESRSSTTKARLLVVSVFVIGFLAGALSLNLYQQWISPNSPERGGDPSNRILKKMDERLSLTTEQEAQIKSILEETFSKYKDIRSEMEPRVKEFEPRFNEARQQGRDRMRAVLSAEQLPKFEEMVKEQDRMRENREEHGKKK